MKKELLRTLKSLAGKRREVFQTEIGNCDCQDVFGTAQTEPADLAYLAGMADCLLILDKLDFFQPEREKENDMRIDKINILPCFKANPPIAEKLERKERYYLRTGEFESQIILDIAGNLIDGYTTYLLARKYGLERVPIKYGRRQVIMAAHRPGGKLYSWGLPGILVGRVKVGDWVLVSTERGCSVVKVSAIEEYADYVDQELEPRRMVIRKVPEPET